MHVHPESPESTILRTSSVNRWGCGYNEVAVDDVKLEVALSKQYTRIPNPKYIEEIQTDEMVPGIRRQILDYMIKIGEYFNIDRLVIGKAILYFDLYLSSTRSPREELTRIALACIVIACKETECSRLPPLTALCSTLKTPTISRDLMVYETKVLDILHWDINVLCAHEMAYEILLRAPPDCLNCKKGSDLREFHLKLLDTSFKLIDILMLDYYSLQWPPSVQGASGVWFAAFVLKCGIAEWGRFVKSFKPLGLDMKSVDNASKRLTAMLKEGSVIIDGVSFDRAQSPKAASPERKTEERRTTVKLENRTSENPYQVAPNPISVIGRTVMECEWREDRVIKRESETKSREWMEGMKKVPAHFSGLQNRDGITPKTGKERRSTENPRANPTQTQTGSNHFPLNDRGKTHNSNTVTHQETAAKSESEPESSSRSGTPFSDELGGHYKIGVAKY